MENKHPSIHRCDIHTYIHTCIQTNIYIYILYTYTTYMSRLFNLESHFAKYLSYKSGSQKTRKEWRKNRLNTSKSNQEAKVPHGDDVFQGFLSLLGSCDKVRKCFRALVSIAGSAGLILWLDRDTPMCSCGCIYCACSIYTAYQRCLVVTPVKANRLPCVRRKRQKGNVATLLSSGKIPSMQHQSFNTIRKRFDS